MEQDSKMEASPRPRVRPDVARAVDRYAQRAGINFNAAVGVLLTASLERAGLWPPAEDAAGQSSSAA